MNRSQKSRLLTHLLLAVLTAAACYIAMLFKPDYKLSRQLTMGFAYSALLYLGFTLVYGLWQMWRSQRRNPVNLYLRRDVGIWSGIAGLLHVWFGFQVHLKGEIWLYFFEPESTTLLQDLFGFSNQTGLLATIILLVLLVISNDISVRLLKGKRWKFLQRFNYLLFILVIAHTVGYQMVVKRESFLQTAVIGLTILVVVVQLAGFLLYRTRQRAKRA